MVLLRTLALLFGAGLLSSCAAFHPLITGPDAPPSEALDIVALRSDASGLTFELRAPMARQGDVVEIGRRTADAQWEPAARIDVTEDLVTPLTTGLVDWLDAPPPEAFPVSYRLVLHRGDGRRASPTITIDAAAPDSPPELHADVFTDPTPEIHLFWSPPQGARLLRRDLLHDEDFLPLAIVDPATEGTLVDADVEPGGVYAYRIQLSSTRSTLTTLSPFSEALYVAVPE